jgi:hypothetical protein
VRHRCERQYRGISRDTARNAVFEVIPKHYKLLYIKIYKTGAGLHTYKNKWK